MKDLTRLLFFALKDEHAARTGHRDEFAHGAWSCDVCSWLRSISREYQKRENEALNELAERTNDER